MTIITWNVCGVTPSDQQDTLTCLDEEISWIAVLLHEHTKESRTSVIDHYLRFNGIWDIENRKNGKSNRDQEHAVPSQQSNEKKRAPVVPSDPNGAHV